MRIFHHSLLSHLQRRRNTLLVLHIPRLQPEHVHRENRHRVVLQQRLRQHCRVGGRTLVGVDDLGHGGDGGAGDVGVVVGRQTNDGGPHAEIHEDLVQVYVERRPSVADGDHDVVECQLRVEIH